MDTEPNTLGPTRKCLLLPFVSSVLTGLRLAALVQIKGRGEWCFNFNALSNRSMIVVTLPVRRTSSTTFTSYVVPPVLRSCTKWRHHFVSAWFPWSKCRHYVVLVHKICSDHTLDNYFAEITCTNDYDDY